MNPDELQEDQALEAVLNEPLPYIEDAGFTARVMDRLPPRRAASRARVPILVCFNVLAALLMFYRPVAFTLTHAFDRLAHPGTLTLSPLPLVSIVLLGMLLWASITAAQSE